MAKRPPNGKCQSRISDAARKEIITMFEAKVDSNEIMAKFNLTHRKLKDLINDYKNGRTTEFTKDEEFKLIELYKDGFNSVKLLRPFFPHIVGHTIRNKIKMFIRWGLLTPTGPFARQFTKPVVEEPPAYITVVDETNADDFFKEFINNERIFDEFTEEILF